MRIFSWTDRPNQSKIIRSWRHFLSVQNFDFSSWLLIRMCKSRRFSLHLGWDLWLLYILQIWFQGMYKLPKLVVDLQQNCRFTTTMNPDPGLDLRFWIGQWRESDSAVAKLGRALWLKYALFVRAHAFTLQDGSAFWFSLHNVASYLWNQLQNRIIRDLFIPLPGPFFFLSQVLVHLTP